MKSARGFAPILIIIAIIMLIPVSHFVNRQFVGIRYPWDPPIWGTNDGGELTQDNLSRLQNPLITPTPAADETASWKTYTNTKYGYEFKYPTDHTAFTSIDQKKPALIPAGSNSNLVAIAETEEQLFCCESSLLRFYIESTDDEAQDWINKFLNKPVWAEVGSDLTKITIEEISFASRSAVEAKGGDGGYHPPYRIIAIPVDIKTLLIIEQDFNSEFYNEILSTFKFTD